MDLPATSPPPERYHLKTALLGVSFSMLPACALPPAAAHTVTPPTSRSEAKGVVRPETRLVREAVLPLLRREMASHQIPGLAIALVRGQHVLWAEGFGEARAGSGIAVDSDTVFQAGSLAKPLTALAVLQLAEAGAVDIDQPYVRYVPEFSLRSRFAHHDEPITPRQLMSHHAGLPTDLRKGMWSGAPFQSVLAGLHEEYAAYPPNTVFSYSNLGYSLLGLLVERISGRSFDDYMREEVFARMDMDHSGYTAPPAALASGHAGGIPAEALSIRDRPAFALYTSAHDMAGFIKTLLGHGHSGRRAVLHEASLQRMWRAQNEDVPLDLDLRIGLGWFLERDTLPGAGRVVRHGGTTLHYSAELILLPDAELGVVVLSNAGGARPAATRIAEATLSAALGQLTAQRQERSPMTRPVIDDLLPGLPAAGSYATSLGLMSIDPEKNRLCACMYQQQYDLFPLPGGWFGLRASGVPTEHPRLRLLTHLQLRFERVDNHDVLIARNGNQRQVLGQRLEGRMPPAWHGYVGRYTLLNPDPDFPVEELELFEENGTLSLRYRMPKLSPQQIRLPLQAVSESEAVVVGLGRSRGDTVVLQQRDGIAHLRFSGYEAARLGRIAAR